MIPILSPEGNEALSRFAVPGTLLAFDFDGTLAPIVSEREKAFLNASTRELLVRLCARYPVAVVTGRARADMRHRLHGINLKEVVGNHGLEWDPPLGDFAEVRRIASEWYRRLSFLAKELEGVEVEDKKYTLSVHYRHAPDREHARRRLQEALDEMGLRHSGRCIGGKAVMNLVPNGVPHKGDAVLRLMERLGTPKAIFAGDDVTDEDALDLPESKGVLGIRVGKSETSRARYYLPAQADMDTLLEILAR